MKLTIIPSDGAVYKDGVCRMPLVWEGTPENVHALQWENDAGWIEYKKHTPPNEDITELPEWAWNAVEAWNQANIQ